MFIGIETKVLKQVIHICHSEIRGEVAAYETHTTYAQPGGGVVEFYHIPYNPPASPSQGPGITAKAHQAQLIVFVLLGGKHRPQGC